MQGNQAVRLPGSSEESKIGQYADDEDLTLLDDFSITKAFEIIHIYERGSGSRLNLGKTEGMWFGSMAGRISGFGSIGPGLSGRISLAGPFLGRKFISLVQGFLYEPRTRCLF